MHEFIKLKGPDHAKTFRWNKYILEEMQPIHMYRVLKKCYCHLIKRYNIAPFNLADTISYKHSTLAHNCMAIMYELEKRQVFFSDNIHQTYSQIKYNLLNNDLFKKDLENYKPPKRKLLIQKEIKENIQLEIIPQNKKEIDEYYFPEDNDIDDFEPISI